MYKYKMDFTALFIIAIVLFFIYFNFKNSFLNITYVKSTVDGRSYLVRNRADKQEAADTLAMLNKKLLQLIDYLVKKDGENIDIKRLKKNFDPDNISESTQYSKYTSYSVNKGEKIVFCIRSKTTNKLEKENILMFVALHELGHLMTKSIGHTEEFWKNFKFLLEEAVKIGIYVKDDFNKNPVEYCGTNITDTPLNE